MSSPQDPIPPNQPPVVNGSPASGRLEGWKEIAGHLRVNQRTAQRWAEEFGLPVRHEVRGKKAFAYAFTAELDAWREARSNVAEPETPEESETSPEPEPPPASAPRAEAPLQLPKLWKWIAAAAAAAVALGGTLTWIFRDGPVKSGESAATTPVAAAPKVGRILVRSTSEGRSLQKVPLPETPTVIRTAPDGSRVYAIRYHKRLLMRVGVRDWNVKGIPLPIEAVALAVAPDGKTVHVSSLRSGIAVIDAEREEVLPERLLPRGGANDLEVSPDGRTLYLAMGLQGVGQLDLKTRTLTHLTRSTNPQFVTVDPVRMRLLVSYQGGGPGGRPGHDAIELFDLRTGQSLFTFSGPPMVGGKAAISPDGEMAWLDPWNACTDPSFDHLGCPQGHATALHVFEIGRRRLVETIGVDFHEEPKFLPDGSRVLVSSTTMRTIHPHTYFVHEQWEHGVPGGGALGISPLGDRVYLGGSPKEMYVLDVEPGECADLPEGLAHFYPLDGSYHDANEKAHLTPVGSVRFVPGKVGQAVRLEGKGSLEASNVTHNRFGRGDSTLAFWVKMDSEAGRGPGGDRSLTLAARMPGARTDNKTRGLTPAARRHSTLFERLTADGNAGWAVRLTGAGRLVFRMAADGGSATEVLSTSALSPGRWYHVAITKADQEIRLHLDGVPDASGATPAGAFERTHTVPIRIGGNGKDAFHGWLDEIAFFDRSLLESEVREMYRKRAEGTCVGSVL